MAQTPSTAPIVDITGYIPTRVVPPAELHKIVDRIEQSCADNWLRWSSCFGKNPELFCSRGYTSQQTPHPKAEDICSMCPVKQMCAQEALNHLDDHAYSVMGGVSLPYTPTKSARTLRELDSASGPDKDRRRKIVWHVCMSLAALEKRQFNTRSAWTIVSTAANWFVFSRVCVELGLKAPKSPFLTANVGCKIRPRSMV